MGIVIIKKYLLNPYDTVVQSATTNKLKENLNSSSSYTPATTNPDAVGSLLVHWHQNLFSHNRYQPVGLIIRSVHTVFTGTTHGFFNGELSFGFLNYSGLSFNSQTASAGATLPTDSGEFTRTIDLMWDGDSRVCWKDLDMDLGVLNHDVSRASFTLTGLESSTDGPIIHDKKAESKPLYVCVVLEYY